MLWGFLKYHHPAVAAGKYNWDAELFRVLPNLLAAHNKAEANRVMENWVDALGKPERCKNYLLIKKNSNTKLMPDYGNLFKSGNFNESLISKLTYIKINRNQGTHYYIGMAPNGNPDFKHENTYVNMLYPDAGYRLLALYRYWNIIQYFFPYKHLIGEDWNQVLPEFIPMFVSAKDELAYTLSCLTLIARIHDTHANLLNSPEAPNNYFGAYFPPVQTKFIEDKLVVTGFYTDTAGIQQQLQKGDVITKVNDEKVEDLIKKLLPTTPASNYETQLRNLPFKILRGTTDRIALKIERDGNRSAYKTHHKRCQGGA